MALKITNQCISCGACEPECPNNAIYESGMPWKFFEGTNISLSEDITMDDLNREHPAKSDDYFYIVSDKCTECVGFYDEPQCASVCPVDCCVVDEDHLESQEDLLLKKKKLHSS